MQIFFPKEETNEIRATILPEVAKKFIDLGIEVTIESGLGDKVFIADDLYAEVGARICPEGNEGFNTADVVCKINKPNANQVSQLKKDSIFISFLDPFNESDLVAELASANVSSISMELVPRITRAQKMDALSSQANLAGYAAVIEASRTLSKSFPMMMTAAGTISPARVFVVGVGVAGLQAIATAKRLGARVEAFDTRPVVEEQVKSLGAKFVKIDLGDTGQTAQGYAKELTPEQMELQKQGMAKVCAQSDVVITTAKLFGRPAPKIVSAEMVQQMKPGSIIVDLAAETGGNVEGTVAGEDVVTENGVIIIGSGPLERTVPTHATQVYSANLANLLEHFWDKEAKAFQLNLEDEILKGCVITHGGKVVHERFQS